MILELNPIFQQAQQMEHLRRELRAMSAGNQARARRLIRSGVPIPNAIDAVKAGIRPRLAWWERPRKKLASLNLPTPNPWKGRRLSRRKRRQNRRRQHL